MFPPLLETGFAASEMFSIRLEIILARSAMFSVRETMFSPRWNTDLLRLAIFLIPTNRPMKE